MIEFWKLDTPAVLSGLNSNSSGLAEEEARERLVLHGPNALFEHAVRGRLAALWNQLKNPVVLLLILAAAASMASGELIDAVIVLAIVSASAWIGYSRELHAEQAVEALRKRIQIRARVLRGGRESTCPVSDIVPGDIVLLSAGSIVPADGRVLEAADFFVNEAALTGESFPVEKKPGQVPAHASLGSRTNCVFLGTNVRSGTARCVIVNTGSSTEFGAIAHRLSIQAPETEFDRGLRHFGYMLAMTMFVIVVLVFGVNVILARPGIDTLLFAIALAVGLSPELLPAILSFNLARGAQLLARQGVLVRQLSAIENLGSMDILCTDKTGTLTEGVVQLGGAFDVGGHRSAEVLSLAVINASLQTGLANPLDEAILQTPHSDLPKGEKLGEVPYDFVRKRLSVVTKSPDGPLLITKGAFENVVKDCVRLSSGTTLDTTGVQKLREQFESWNREGTRVLAVATKRVDAKGSYGRADETELTFVGFLTFSDIPKASAGETLQALQRLGVTVKLITGDAMLVAQHVASQVGMDSERILTGAQLDELHDDALWRAAEQTSLFVEVDPNQKERIILALKKAGHVVGFLGDGINDAPALHAADTGITVEGAADVAREAADFVLLDRNLEVIRHGVEEGRKTFANTLKYILMTISANLGNMVSMAVASILLPFLPLLASQILLNNFLSDIPAVGLADDAVDSELIDHPRRWNISFVRGFMIRFGLLSSAFDFLTFAYLSFVLHAGPELFRTAWFVESLLTEVVIALVVRSRRPFYRSRPGNVLLWSSLLVAAAAPVIPRLPYSNLIGFVPLTASTVATLFSITFLYVFAAELMKREFFRTPHAGT
ncbi:MAG: magnesium-translocating P-type ATPase [Bdellovibrionota bacterium]